MKKIINYLAFLLSIGTITLSSCGGSSDKPITPPAPAESDLKYDENGNPIFKNGECGRFIGLVLDNLSYIHFYSNNLIVF